MSKISEKFGEIAIVDITETKKTINDKGEVVYTEDENKKNYADANVKKIIDTGMKALPDMLRVIVDTDNPKMYDAASNFMVSLAKLNQDYAEGSKADKEQSKKEVNTQNNTTNNHIICMSSKEVIDFIDGD